MSLLKDRVWLVIGNILYYLSLVVINTKYKEYFNIHYYQFSLLVYAYPIILWFLFKFIYNSFLGGKINRARFSSDPEKWLFVVCLIPTIGAPIITIRIHQKLNELQKEMNKQGVTNINNFKPLPTKKGRNYGVRSISTQMPRVYSRDQKT
jgi:hypothetical protein